MASRALDGGWGWAIVGASFLAQLLAYGSPQSVGVLYPEWLDAFQEGKGLTAWVGSLVAGVGLIASEYHTVARLNARSNAKSAHFVGNRFPEQFCACDRCFLYMGLHHFATQLAKKKKKAIMI